MALVLALGSMGLGYAAWIDTVTISGTVDTGSLCIDIDSPELGDGPVQPPPYLYDTVVQGQTDVVCNNPGPGFHLDTRDTLKNVGWGTVEQVLPIPGTDLYKGLELNLYNVYPCYYNHLDFWLHGCGSIPARIYTVTFKDELGNVLPAWDENGDPMPNGAILDYMNTLPNGTKYLAFDFNENGVYDFEIHWGDHFGSQLHECDSVNISMAMHVMQDLDMEGGETFSFVIEVSAIQWDEYPY